MTVYIRRIVNMTNSRHATINLENTFQGKLAMLQYLFKLYKNEARAFNMLRTNVTNVGIAVYNAHRDINYLKQTGDLCQGTYSTN